MLVITQLQAKLRRASASAFRFDVISANFALLLDSLTALTATSGVIITARRQTRTMKSLVRRCTSGILSADGAVIGAEVVVTPTFGATGETIL